MPAASVELRLFGYFPRRVAPPEAWLAAAGVSEVCSLSHTALSGPEGWVDHWLHSSLLGFFDSPELARRVVPAGAQGFRIFAYRLLLTRFRDGVGEAWYPDLWPDPVPLEPGHRSLGFDVVGRFMEDILGFECSPMACFSGVAAEVGVNPRCLMDTLDGAVAVAQRFSLEVPSEAPYFVAEVLEKPAAQRPPATETPGDLGSPGPSSSPGQDSEQLQLGL